MSVSHRPGTEVHDVVGCGAQATVHRACMGRRCVFAVSTYARRQAAFELGCGEQDLVETVIGDGRVSFEGCRGQAVLVQRGDQWLSSQSSAAEVR